MTHSKQNSKYFELNQQIRDFTLHIKSYFATTNWNHIASKSSVISSHDIIKEERAWWSSGRIVAMQVEGHRFESDPNHCLETLASCSLLIVYEQGNGNNLNLISGWFKCQVDLPWGRELIIKQTGKHLNTLLENSDKSLHPPFCFTADDYHQFLGNKVNGIRERTSKADPATFTVHSGPGLVLFADPSEADVTLIVMSLPCKQCQADPLPMWLLKESIETLAPFLTTRHLWVAVNFHCLGSVRSSTRTLSGQVWAKMK